jgi:hypothetical protein
MPILDQQTRGWCVIQWPACCMYCAATSTCHKTMSSVKFDTNMSCYPLQLLVTPKTFSIRFALLQWEPKRGSIHATFSTH